MGLFGFGGGKKRQLIQKENEEWNEGWAERDKFLTGKFEEMFPGWSSEEKPEHPFHPIGTQLREHFDKNPEEAVTYYQNLPLNSWESAYALEHLRGIIIDLDEGPLWELINWAVAREDYAGYLLLGICLQRVGSDDRGLGLASELTLQQIQEFEGNFAASAGFLEKAFELDDSRDANIPALAQQNFIALEGFMENYARWAEVTPWNILGWAAFCLQVDERWFGGPDSQIEACQMIANNCTEHGYIMAYVPTMIHFRYDYINSFETDFADAEAAHRRVYDDPRVREALLTAWKKWFFNPNRHQMPSSRSAAMRFFFGLCMAGMDKEAFLTLPVTHGYWEASPYDKYFRNAGNAFREMAKWAIAKNEEISPILNPHFYKDEDGDNCSSYVNPDAEDARRVGLLG